MYAIPLACLAAAIYFRKSGVTRARKTLWICAIYFSMLAQSAVLLIDGQWSLATGLPLHLCGFSGILALPALMLETPALKRFFIRASSSGALMALLFPAVYPTKLMTLGEISFFLLHSLLLALPLLLTSEKAAASLENKSRLRRSRGTTGMYRICLTLLVSALIVNQTFQANYLFLRALPRGTPFEALNACPEALRFLAALALAIALSYAGKREKRSPVDESIT